MTDVQAWLDHGRTLADQATDGPWVAEFSRETGDCVIPHDAQSTREAVATTHLLHAPADAAFIADARTRLPAALAALQAVLNLHHPVEVEPSEPLCLTCSTPLPNGRYMPVVEWPCPTARAIQEALTSQPTSREHTTSSPAWSGPLRITQTLATNTPTTTRSRVAGKEPTARLDAPGDTTA